MAVGSLLRQSGEEVLEVVIRWWRVRWSRGGGGVRWSRGGGGVEPQ